MKRYSQTHTVFISVLLSTYFWFITPLPISFFTLFHLYCWNSSEKQSKQDVYIHIHTYSNIYSFFQEWGEGDLKKLPPISVAQITRLETGKSKVRVWRQSTSGIPYCSRKAVFILLMLSPDWIRPTQVLECNQLYSMSAYLNVAWGNGKQASRAPGRYPYSKAETW